MNIYENWKKFLNEEETKVFLRDLSSGIKKYKDSVWVFFDTETTGMDGRHAQLTEIAAISVRSDLAEDAAVISQYHKKANLTPETEKKRLEPHVPKNPRDKSIDDILKMTQYFSNPDNAEYKEEKDALSGFLKYLKSVSSEGKIVLIAHNANFDKNFIDARNKLYGLPPINYEIIDTLQIMQEIFYPLLHVVDELGILPKIKKSFGYSFTLENMSNALDISAENHHSALPDVRMLIKVTRAIVRLLEKNGDIDVTSGYEAAMKRKAELDRWNKKKASQLSEIEEKPDEYDIQESFSHWLNEGRLSKYWKRRMEARSKRAKRESKNQIDKEWAQSQQEKSRKMNAKIHKIFQNEMEVTEELSEEINAFLEKVEQKRQERLKKIQEVEFIPLNKKRPKKKLPPLPNNSTIGKTSGVVDAYDKKRKKIKGPGAAPGEKIASLHENMDLFNKLSDVQKENFHKLIGDVEEYDILKLRLGKKTKNILTQFNLQIEDVIELLQKCPSLQQPISSVLTAGTKGFIYLLKNDHVLKLFQEDYSGGSDLSWYAYNKSRMFQSDGNVTELAIFDPAHIKLSSGEFVNYVEMARVDPLSDFIENTGRSADSAENDYERCKELLMDLDAKYGKKYYSFDVDKFENVFINYMQKLRVKLETLTKREFVNLAKTVFLFEKAGNTLHDSHVGNIGKLPQSSPENPIFVIFDN